MKAGTTGPFSTELPLSLSKTRCSHVNAGPVLSPLLFHFLFVCPGPLSRLLPLHGKSPNRVALVLQPCLLFHECFGYPRYSAFPCEFNNQLIIFYKKPAGILTGIKVGRTDILRQYWVFCPRVEGNRSFKSSLSHLSAVFLFVFLFFGFFAMLILNFISCALVEYQLEKYFIYNKKSGFWVIKHSLGHKNTHQKKNVA